MQKRGILNPGIRSLLSRVRHTNTLVLADRGFPYWPQIETIDISLSDDIPRILEVLRAIREECNFGIAYMAEEFRVENCAALQAEWATALNGMTTVFEPHVQFKQRVPSAIGLIRTGETVQYANMILESA